MSKLYKGLDVSLEMTSLCVIDEEGRIKGVAMNPQKPLRLYREEKLMVRRRSAHELGTRSRPVLLNRLENSTSEWMSFGAQVNTISMMSSSVEGPYSILMESSRVTGQTHRKSVQTP